MEIKKPKDIQDSVWEQHLRWMDVTDTECSANRLKREQAPRKDGMLIKS